VTGFAIARRLVGAPARLVDSRLPPGRTRSLVTAALGTLVVGLLVAVLVLGRQHLRDGRIAAAREAGLAAAVELTPLLLTYDHRTLAADTERAEASTTGEFAGQYRELIRASIAPNAGALRLVTKAEVRESSLVTAEDGRVVALLFLSQVTTSSDLTAPRLDSSGVRVTVTEVDGRWLISGLDRV
jgi:Mce-associated membrane protein